MEDKGKKGFLPLGAAVGCSSSFCACRCSATALHCTSSLRLHLHRRPRTHRTRPHGNHTCAGRASRLRHRPPGHPRAIREQHRPPPKSETRGCGPRSSHVPEPGLRAKGPFVRLPQTLPALSLLRLREPHGRPRLQHPPPARCTPVRRTHDASHTPASPSARPHAAPTTTHARPHDLADTHVKGADQG